MVRTGPVTGLGDLAMEQIDTSAPVGLLYDLPVPVMRLRERARVIKTGGRAVHVADPEDLLFLRRRRPGAGRAEKREIRFLQELIARRRHDVRAGG